jgi:hypothetical protein
MGCSSKKEKWRGLVRLNDKVVSLFPKLRNLVAGANLESGLFSSFRKLNAGFCSIHVF